MLPIAYTHRAKRPCPSGYRAVALAQPIDNRQVEKKLISLYCAFACTGLYLAVLCNICLNPPLL